MKTTETPLRFELEAAIVEAVSPVLNRHIGPDLPPLRWNTRNGEGGDMVWGGYASSVDYDENETRRVVEQWAATFGFETSEDQHGTIEFRGWIRDVFVIVWGVVDREAFERRG